MLKHLDSGFRGRNRGEAGGVARRMGGGAKQGLPHNLLEEKRAISNGTIMKLAMHALPLLEALFY